MASDRELPTWPQIKRSAAGDLHRARVAMADVRDWLNSDWSPAGSPLSDADANARREVLRIVGQVKNLIDQAKDILHG